MGEASSATQAAPTQKSDLQISNPQIFPSPGVNATADGMNVTTSIATTLRTEGLSTSFTTPYTTSISSTSSLTCYTACTSSPMNPASATTSSATPVPVDDSSKVNGLIAGLVLFAILFLVMTVLLIWSIRRKRANRYTTPDQPFITARKPSMDPSLSGMEHTIASLETQLHEKDSQLRERQMLMLAKGQSISRMETINKSVLSDEDIRERFTKLQTSIIDWVELYFGSSKFATSPIPDVLKTVEKTFPQYQTLLEDNRMVKVVLEGLVADILCQAFASGQLLGNEAFWELKQAIISKVTPKEANEWRAMTSRLLEKIPSYQSDRTEAVEDLSQTIDAACSELTKTRPKEARRASLEQLVDYAATLAIDLAKQQALIKVEKPVGSMFIPETMCSVDDKEDVAGRHVRAVLFPMVTKSGGEAGGGWDRSRVVLKAKVLL